MAKRATKPPVGSYEEFVFNVRAPSLSYSFGIEHDRHWRERRLFGERHTLDFATDCFSPDRLKGRQGKGTITPEPGMVDDKLLPENSPTRKWIGFIRATKVEFETVVWLPPEICWRIGDGMASGQIRTMLTSGPVEPRGMFRILRVSFRGAEFDVAAYLG